MERIEKLFKLPLLVIVPTPKAFKEHRNICDSNNTDEEYDRTMVIISTRNIILLCDQHIGRDLLMLFAHWLALEHYFLS